MSENCFLVFYDYSIAHNLLFSNVIFSEFHGKFYDITGFP